MEWNLCLLPHGGGYKVIMPDRDTGKVQAPIGKHGFLVHWPINPWFTGINSIASILNATEEFKNIPIYTEEL